MKNKYLQNVTIEIPRSSLSANVSKISRKSHSYDIWSVRDGDDRPIGGDEVGRLECLFSRNGIGDDTYLAPGPARRLAISEATVLPPATESSTNDHTENCLAQYSSTPSSRTVLTRNSLSRLLTPETPHVWFSGILFARGISPLIDSFSSWIPRRNAFLRTLTALPIHWPTPPRRMVKVSGWIASLVSYLASRYRAGARVT